ncbi:MAG: MATE family efflux transporter [Pseudomonadota bacterium]
MSNSSGKFLEGNLMRHVSVMSFTSAIGLMAIFAVDFVDMIFIGMLGSDALAAAVGYAGTVIFFTNAMNIGMSIAAGSLVSQSIGADKPGLAREYATSVAVLVVAVGIAIPLIAIPFLPQIMALLGATGEVQQLAVRYTTIILPTMSLMGLAMAASAVLRAHGDAKRAMYTTLSGGIVNAVLDPIFIFGFGLGLDGAAYASVVARFVMAAVSMREAIKVYQAYCKPTAALVTRDAGIVLGIAVPAVATNIATPFGNAIVTREMAQFGTDAVAGMAIIGRIMPMAFAVILALSGAIGPIVGQNYGAGKYDRVRGAYTAGMQFIVLYVLFATAVLFVLRDSIAGLFNAEGLTRDLIFLYCGPLALASIFNGIVFMSNAVFNNLGHPIYSAWINWGRHSIGTYPFAVAGGIWLGAQGVLIGQAAGGLIFAVVAIWLVKRVIANLDADREPDPFHPDKRFLTILGRRH